jgi:hypothetical protein
MPPCTCFVLYVSTYYLEGRSLADVDAVLGGIFRLSPQLDACAARARHFHVLDNGCGWDGRINRDRRYQAGLGRKAALDAGRAVGVIYRTAKETPRYVGDSLRHRGRDTPDKKRKDHREQERDDGDARAANTAGRPVEWVFFRLQRETRLWCVYRHIFELVVIVPFTCSVLAVASYVKSCSKYSTYYSPISS